MLTSLKSESQKKKEKFSKKERQEQRIIDLLTVKAALSVLRESCWYWGNISGERAREVLLKSAPGTFLIRDSSDKRYLFSLSVMTLRGPTSIRLIFSRGCFRIETSGIISPRSPCVVSLIIRMAYLSQQNHPPITELENDNEHDEAIELEPNSPIKLKKQPALLEKPLLCKAPSLKHLARVAVNKHNLRHLANEPLQEYIHQYPYPN